MLLLSYPSKDDVVCRHACVQLPQACAWLACACSVVWRVRSRHDAECAFTRSETALTGRTHVCSSPEGSSCSATPDIPVMKVPKTTRMQQGPWSCASATKNAATGITKGAANKTEQLHSANSKAWQHYVAAGSACTRNRLHTYLHPNLASPLPAGSRHCVQPQHVHCESGSPAKPLHANPLTHQAPAHGPPLCSPRNSQHSRTPPARRKRPSRAPGHQTPHAQCSWALAEKSCMP